LVGMPDGNRPLGGPRCRWGDNIGMDFQEVAWGYGMHWDRDRWWALVNAVINLQGP
jgi:hypothetical protein